MYVNILTTNFKGDVIMAEMIDIMFDKLYRYDRIAEPCGVCIPVGKGKLYNTDKVSIYQDFL